MSVNDLLGPAQQTAAFQVSLPYRAGCENHPLATDMPALFFPNRVSLTLGVWMGFLVSEALACPWAKPWVQLVCCWAIQDGCVSHVGTGARCHFIVALSTC